MPSVHCCCSGRAMFCIGVCLSFAILSYVISSSLVLGFYRDRQMLGRVGSIIGLLPAVAGIYVVCFKLKRTYMAVLVVMAILTLSISFIGACLVFIDLGVEWKNVGKRYRVVGLVTALCMMVTGLFSILSVVLCSYTCKEESIEGNRANVSREEQIYLVEEEDLLI